jgi:hypothetical protein
VGPHAFAIEVDLVLEEPLGTGAPDLVPVDEYDVGPSLDPGSDRLDHRRLPSTRDPGGEDNHSFDRLDGSHDLVEPLVGSASTSTTKCPAALGLAIPLACGVEHLSARDRRE